MDNTTIKCSYSPSAARTSCT